MQNEKIKSLDFDLNKFQIDFASLKERGAKKMKNKFLKKDLKNMCNEINLGKLTEEDSKTLIILFYIRKFFRNKDINCILNKSNDFEFSYKNDKGNKEMLILDSMDLFNVLKLGLQKNPKNENDIELFETEDININCSLSEEYFFTFSYENLYGNKIKLSIDLIDLANYLVSDITRAIFVILAKYIY